MHSWSPAIMSWIVDCSGRHQERRGGLCQVRHEHQQL